jgi:RHH-type transcriptional regulator, proline utilization regulon repressor / proline dehydrogenase / delta 1-pyrroline-5-carboxylate dehydrogenase
VLDTQRREREIREVAKRIAELGGRQRAHLFHLSWWSDRLLARSMADPSFRTSLFRFVDAFPSLRDDEDVEDHLRSEFEGVDVPRWFGTGLGLAKNVPGGARLSAGVARRSIDRMARQFIIGSDAEEVARAVGELWGRRTGATVDVLGEHTFSESEADRYAARFSRLVESLGAAAAAWPPDELLESDNLGPIPRASVSIKISALASSYTPLEGDEAIERAAHRLLPILRRASQLGVSAWFDMEHYEEKDLTHRLFRRVLSVPGLEALHAGIVIQAYLRDAMEDLETLADWARGRSVVPSVRLVKGAYWDTETLHAAQRGWPPPVFEHKVETDANFERLARRLLEHQGSLRAAFATHNLRSLASAIVDAKALSIPDNGYELQLLYGMAEPVHEAVRRMGLRLRVYAPMGELVPGMAYLVRRLLENTSNESFVRHRFAEGEDLGTLLVRPSVGELPALESLQPRAATAADDPGPYRPEPVAQFLEQSVRGSFGVLVNEEFSRPVRQVAAVIGGEKVKSGHDFVSVDPDDPESVVAQVVSCGRSEVDAAVSAAAEAVGPWRKEDPVQRAAVLFRAAEHMRSRRFELSALEVRETGKGWADADADVCEAIDYCEYYGRRMMLLAHGGEVLSPPGEANRLVYRSRGICAVVSPWNFPLAIPTGMLAAALVTGNAVVLKPAEQAPAVAAELVNAFSAAGLPPGVISFLPGSGVEAGAPLVEHPDVDTIAFTGSREVGLSILETAFRRVPQRRMLPRVVAELGGKNAIVVDADADLDEVVPAVIQSAFGFAGQKCSAASRLIAVDRIHDAVVERVTEATRSLVIGSPRRPSSQLGPVIDAEAYERINSALSRAGECGDVALLRSDLPERGWYVSPAVVTGVDPSSWLANDELFAPVLATFSVPDFEAALELANRTDYALTAGVFSRSSEHIALSAETLRAGNVYVNRSITGAVVGRQPFGGNGMSGVGSKAGGPDYLLQFLDAQVVSENTVRQGFAPEELGERPTLRERPEQNKDTKLSERSPLPGRGVA